MEEKKYTLLYLYAIGLFFILAMNYYQPGPGGYGLNLAVNSTSWIAFSIIICVGLLKWIRCKQLKLSKTAFILSVVIVCLFLPLLWSESPWRETAYGRYLAIVAFLMLILSSQQFTLDQKNSTIFWAIIVFGILLQCLMGIYQFYMFDDLMLVTNFRPIGSFQQVNVYASMIATGLGISIYQCLSQKLPKSLISLHYLMIFFAGMLETLILSRVGVLGALSVAIMLALLFRSEVKQLLIIVLLLVLGIVGAISMKAFNESGTDTSTPTYDRNVSNVSNVSGRTVIYSTTLSLIKSAPILGHGLGSFSYKYLDEQARLVTKNPKFLHSTINSQTHPHNEILFWWAEGGLLPVVALVFFVVWFGVRVWRYGDIAHKAAWLCCIPIILHTQTEYPLYHSIPHFALLALLITLSAPEIKQTYNANFSLLPALILCVLPLAVTVFMATNLQAIWLLNQYNKYKKPHYLFDIVNPLGNTKLLAYNKSELFLSSDNPEVIAEAKKLMQHERLVRPQERTYWFLYHVEKFSEGRELEAQELYRQGKYLFPQSTAFK